VRRSRKEPRLPPPMKASEKGIFGGERTKRISEGVKVFYGILSI
jgi:hypothetical protein